MEEKKEKDEKPEEKPHKRWVRTKKIVIVIVILDKVPRQQ